MKRLILCGVFVLVLSGIINAQTNNGSSSTSSSDTMHSISKGQAGKKSKKAKKDTQLNNSKNYYWKNGQQATPTGNEATGVNSGYSTIGRDSTKKGKKQ